MRLAYPVRTTEDFLWVLMVYDLLWMYEYQQAKLVMYHNPRRLEKHFAKEI